MEYIVYIPHTSGVCPHFIGPLANTNQVCTPIELVVTYKWTALLFNHILEY